MVSGRIAFDVETLVIGGGVAGLAIAHALVERGRRVLLVEMHDHVGAETSSRNSEVIHAGLYYPPGSLKARLCVTGKAMLYRFASDNGVPFKRLGKLLVATSAAEISKLEAIARTAALNGVDDLERLDGSAVEALEPDLACAAAYLSPSTGIIDSHALMTALEGHIQAGGGDVVFGTRVTSLAPVDGGGFAIALDSGGASDTLSAREVIIAAGLWSSDLARSMFAATSPSSPPRHAPYAPPATFFAKGHYFTLAGKAPFRRLIYPMPEDGGLGVHLTLDMAGAAKFGPDVTWVDRVSYDFDDGCGARRAAFEAAIRRWWPGLPRDALNEGYTGIRPKLSSAGEAAADFAIHGPETHGLAGLVALYGIESPGLTASLAIGAHVAALLS
ncbi:MAG: NAD(P)/FAD-dependent oxidoreductase [Hyphomicrobiaceae bacterium]|nr:NAD(P)/FAD-dependent oxidoreductase [Hyphomicrobiaceae bacterium]